MEVILKSAHPKLGQKGDIVAVKAGYGRNYLIPQGIALVADKANRKVALEDSRQAAGKALRKKANAQVLADALAALRLVVRAKVGERGHMFGAITPLQISKSLKEQGITVDYTHIHLELPIKQIGSYQAILTLHEEVTHTLHFDVVSA